VSSQQFKVPLMSVLPGFYLLAEKRETPQGKEKTHMLTKYLTEGCAENFTR